MRQWRKRKKTLGVFSKYAKRCKSVNISENTNTNKKIFQILTNYTIWDGLSQKTISRYCPFKQLEKTILFLCIYETVSTKHQITACVFIILTSQNFKYWCSVPLYEQSLGYWGPVAMTSLSDSKSFTPSDIYNVNIQWQKM